LDQPDQGSAVRGRPAAVAVEQPSRAQSVEHLLGVHVAHRVEPEEQARRAARDDLRGHHGQEELSVARRGQPATIRCEICGRRVDPWAEFRYARAAPGAASVMMRGPPPCSECRRRGCPSCMCVVGEWADDFFFDEFLCSACLKKNAPQSGLGGDRGPRASRKSRVRRQPGPQLLRIGAPRMRPLPLHLQRPRRLPSVARRLFPW